MKKIFITGTNTDKGKTFVTSVLLKLLSKSYQVGVMKAVETGSNTTSMDIANIKSINKNILPREEHLQNPYLFKLASSPHLAAKKEDKTIDKNHILEAILTIEKKYDLDILLIEGAGGILVPLTEEYYISDLIKDLNCPIILVADALLGTINDTLLSHYYLEQNLPQEKLIVLNKMNDSIIAQENESFLRKKLTCLLTSIAYFQEIEKACFSDEEEVLFWINNIMKT